MPSARAAMCATGAGFLQLPWGECSVRGKDLLQVPGGRQVHRWQRQGPGRSASTALESHAPVMSCDRGARSLGRGDHPGVTLNKNLFETALHYLLVESGEHSVHLYEGSGSSWRKTR